MATREQIARALGYPVDRRGRVMGPEIKYGTLEGRPVVITSSRLARGYWLIEGKWVLMNPGDVTHMVALRTKDEFEKRFPKLARVATALERLDALPTDGPSN